MYKPAFKKIAAILFLCIFVFVHYSVFANLHTHRQYDGNIIFHGHPLHGAKDTNTSPSSHQHSEFEFLFLDIFVSNFTLLQIGFAFLFFILILLPAFQLDFQFNYTSPFFLIYKRRGPPLLAS